MPSVAVIVPWRTGCPHREAAWRWVRARYQQAGWAPIEGKTSDGPWCKAEAVADGIRNTAADILVVADADVWSDATIPAVDLVAAGVGWVVPRCEVRRLTPGATAEVLDGAPLTTDLPLEQNPYGGVTAGGIVVLSRQAWETAPLDRRFVGWGSEDEAWGTALTGLVGRPVILDWHQWPLWHLWHPPQPRLSRAVGSRESAELARRYRTARNSPSRLRQLVDAGRP